MAIMFIVVMLIIIYIVAQNNKLQLLFDGLYRIDSEIERKIGKYVDQNGEIDIYALQEIRTMIIKDYMHNKVLDDFRVYKESMYKIKLILRAGLAVQSLEMVTNVPMPRLVEIPLENSDMDMLEKS